MIPQVILYTIPCGIALDRVNKKIAFNRPDQNGNKFPVFIDIREGIQCVWGTCGISLDMVEYAYNEFYAVEGKIKDYFHSLITADFVETGRGVFLPNG